MSQEEPKNTSEEVKNQTFTHSKNIHMKKIYVGNIPKNTTSEDLQNYFSNFGEVVQTSIFNGPKTEIPWHYSLITFASEDCTQKVLAHRNHVLLGKVISVRPFYNRSKKEIHKDESKWITERSENLVEKDSIGSEPLKKPKETAKKLGKKNCKGLKGGQRNAKHDVEENRKNEKEKEEQIEIGWTCPTAVSEKVAAPTSKDRSVLIAESIQLIMNVSEEVTNKLKIKKNSQFHDYKNVSSTSKECEKLANEFSSGREYNFKEEENLIDLDDDDVMNNVGNIVNSFQMQEEGKYGDVFTCGLCAFSCPISSLDDIFRHSNSTLHKVMLKNRYKDMSSSHE